MRRREFIGLLGGVAAAWPMVARTQQSGGMKRVGVLMGYAESDREGQVRIAAFREGLQKLGWTEGRNLRIDSRWATAGDAEAHPRSAKELVALQPDLILSHNTPTTAALLRETRTIAIVFASVTDPVGSGFVASFPRPGGNVTGFTNIEPTMAGKSLELLKEIAPTVKRPSCSTRQQRHTRKCSLTPSRPPLRPLPWRRSEPLFVTPSNSIPLLPNRHAPRMAASSR
jgi:putative ABC transport system substrate-binding protein